MAKHVMLDLETFGTKPGSIIRSIGAVVFSPDGGPTGAEFYANIDHESCVDVGLTSDPATVAWWSKQAEATRAALLKDPEPLSVVVHRFDVWFSGTDASHVWCQGANFDAPLWEAACRAVGVRTSPWKFWNVRDTRTVYELCEFEPHGMTRLGTYHNALDDARFQALCVQMSVKRLKQSKVAA